MVWGEFITSVYTLGDEVRKVFLMVFFVGWMWARFSSFTQLIDFMNQRQFNRRYDFRSAKITTSFGDYILIYFYNEEMNP